MIKNGGVEGKARCGAVELCGDAVETRRDKMTRAADMNDSLMSLTINFSYTEEADAQKA